MRKRKYDGEEERYRGGRRRMGRRFGGMVRRSRE